jgi:glycosyltransferase involved in cell wall biosynthesis
MKEFRGKISVVMPAYNEAQFIAHSIRETALTFNGFGWDWELLIMDDGSTDSTYEIAQSLAAEYPGRIQVKRNPVNVGKGRAVKKAGHFISGDYVLFLDADMDLHPVQAATLFDIMELDNADVVIGSKLHPNSQVKYPIERRIVSFIYYLLVRLLFNLPCHDTQTGLKLFRVEVLRSVLPLILVRKFAYDLEILANAHRMGYKIAEAPIVLSPKRQYGRIGLKAVFTTLVDTLAVFYRMHILHYYDRIDHHRRKGLE